MFRDPHAFVGEHRQLRDGKPLATVVAGWCEEYALTRDPELRRMIVERHQPFMPPDGPETS